jgi:hypothetical protein
LLRIDLLPGHFAAARAARATLVLMVIALLVTILGCFAFLTMKKAELAKVQKEYEEAHRQAEVVRGIEKDAQAKEALAAPVDAKVSFIEDADDCGEQWLDAFEKVNRYIYAQARVTAIRIQAPNAVHFEVDVPDTTACGRFVLNLIRCPDISNIRIGGSPPSGPGIGPNARASGGGGAMPGAMPGMMGMGEPGMGMGGGMPGPEMGGMPGPPGMMGGGGGGPTAVSRAGGPIHLSVDANLAKALSTPVPGGGAAAGAGGMPGAPAGGMPGMPGMPGAGMSGIPAGEPPGAGAPAGPAGPPSGVGSKAGGAGGEEGGGGGLGKRREVDTE